MEIRKIVSFSEEELNALTTAGKLLGAVKKALDDKEVDDLSDDSKQLLDALAKVLDGIRLR